MLDLQVSAIFSFISLIMNRLVEKNLDAGFKGNIGIEFEGTELSKDEGIKATKDLIEKLLK